MRSQPESVFKDRHYSLQALIGLVTTNYIIFALMVQVCVKCTGIHWFLWVTIAGLALYNYYIIGRNREEFEEKKTQIIYVASIVGMGVLYYLLGVVALHCDTIRPL